MDKRLLQVSPWQGSNPQRTTGGAFSPKVWANAMLEQMQEGISLQKQINEGYESILTTGKAVVRIKLKP